MGNGGGRPALGTISGILLGLFVFLLLVVYGGVAINSTVAFIVSVAGGLVLGMALGIIGPLGRRRGRPAAGPAAPQPPLSPGPNS